MALVSLFDTYTLGLIYIASFFVANISIELSPITLTTLTTFFSKPIAQNRQLSDMTFADETLHYDCNMHMITDIPDPPVFQYTSNGLRVRPGPSGGVNALF